MSLDWENQYFQNDYTAQDNLQIQCNSYEIIDDFFFFLASLEQKVLKFI